MWLAFSEPSVLLAKVGPRLDRRAAARGFTLTELLAVLAMVGVLVVGASPTFVRLMRDRRVARAAFQLVDMIRTARTLAIGHGQPVLVRWVSAGLLTANDSTAGTGAMQIVEPIVTTSTQTATCGNTAWNTAATQVVGTFDIQNGAYSYAAITFFDDLSSTPATPGSGTASGYAEICFSPTGRMYLRVGSGTTSSDPFHVVLGVPSFGVYNLQNNSGKLATAPTTRWVLVPSNGAARMAL